jgi:hypothetical protein
MCGEDQYSETNLMHFLFGLLRIKGLHMFGPLLAHPQALHKRHQFHCIIGAANSYNTHAMYQVPFVRRLLRMSK